MQQDFPIEQKNAKFGLKSFITVVAILLAVVIAVGVLTYVIPAGEYDRYPQGAVDANGNDLSKQIIPDSYHVVTNHTPLPVWRWFTAPFEALVIGQGNMNIIQVLALLLILGGTFRVLQCSGGLISLVRMIIQKLYKRRFVAVWVITLVLMILSAVFGLQEQLLILYPLFAMLCTALNWSNFTAICFILITSGVGFTTAITNPFTVGTASLNAGISVLDGMWFRVVIFAIMFVITGLYMSYICRRDERLAVGKVDLSMFDLSSEEEKRQDKHKAMMIVTLFTIALGGVVIAIAIDALRSFSMFIMGGAFIVGTLVIGRKLLGSFKALGKAFVGGMKDVAPSIVIVLLAFSVKYIADKGKILDSIFYWFYGIVTGQSPYVAVLLLYAFILVVEFFIPSASAKAVLLIPMLTLAPIPGISINVIVLTYLFADGYTNILFPTCGTLLIGLGLADVGFATWVKKTIVFQLILLAMSLGFLMLAIAIGL